MGLVMSELVFVKAKDRDLYSLVSLAEYKPRVTQRVGIAHEVLFTSGGIALDAYDRHFARSAPCHIDHHNGMTVLAPWSCRVDEHIAWHHILDSTGLGLLV